jgi:predicted nucleotidyltransferase
LTAIKDCLRHYPDIKWVKIYGSRAKGNYRRGSDIDLAFSCSTDYAANLLASLDNLPTPYLFDVTHYESLRHNDLKAHIDRIGVVIYQQETIESDAIGS